MKQINVIFFSLFYSFIAKSNVLVVEGKFQNKNIYIQNAFGTNGVGFCTTEIKVNGAVTTDEINYSEGNWYMFREHQVSYIVLVECLFFS